MTTLALFVAASTKVLLLVLGLVAAFGAGIVCTLIYKARVAKKVMPYLGIILMAALLVGVLVTPAVTQVKPYQVAGRYVASEYGNWSLYTQSAITAGAASVRLDRFRTISNTTGGCYVPTAGPGGKRFTPAMVGVELTLNDGANAETVLITAVNGCTVTATFGNSHNANVEVTSGTSGLAEAIQDAAGRTGGVVVITPDWGGSTADITGADVRDNVILEDARGALQYFNPMPGATVMATPTALSADPDCTVAGTTLCSDASVAGTWTAGAVYGCVAYVDKMGNEGPCSTTANFTAVVSKAINVVSPAASTGAVGYTVYLSLVGGSYAFAYKVPLTSSICALTTKETVTPACAIGSNAQVTAITVNTAPLALQAGVISSTADYVGNTNAHTTYTWGPSGKAGIPGLVTSSSPFPTGAAANTTVPSVIGTLTLPAGFMNYLGKTIKICGHATQAANGSTSTVTSIHFWWDAPGSNAAGVPDDVGGPVITNTLVTANADQWDFCQSIRTTALDTGTNNGSLQAVNGYLTESYGAAGVAPGTAPNTSAAAVASLNLRGLARIHVVYLHTTGQDANGVKLQNLTVEVQ